MRNAPGSTPSGQAGGPSEGTTPSPAPKNPPPPIPLPKEVVPHVYDKRDFWRQESK